jgi:squalene-associated FAD-dependent desaturase
MVAGAGCAGLSAAVRLTGAGARVLVLEARSRLGGRATAFTDQETGELVDNGQHVLFGCYRDTFAFLETIGALDGIRLDPVLRVTMIDRRGIRTRLDCPSLPAPLHLLAGVLDWADRFAVLRMVAPLRLARRALEPGARVIAASPGETVASWLERNGQTARLRELLWEPLALAALNQPARQAAAPPFVRVLAEMFGADPKAAAVGLPTRPLHLMYAEPARAFIERKGGEVRTGAAARVHLSGSTVAAVEANGERWRPAATIAAVPWFALGELLTGDVASLAGTLERARATAASPIVTVNLWFDRPITDEPFVGLPGRPFQWLFDKRLAFGGSAAHCSLVSSGAADKLGRSNEELIGLAEAEVREALPESQTAARVRATVIREPRATFSLAPGAPPRPATETPVPGLFLAGDWIATGLPATIESAVRSGHRAAEAAARAAGASVRAAYAAQAV